MKPSRVSRLDPRKRIGKSRSDYSKVESRIVSDEVSLGVSIDKGLQISRLDQSMLRSVRDRDKSESRDLMIADHLGRA